MQLDDLREPLTEDNPQPVPHHIIQVWARIYGLISLDDFGHLDFTHELELSRWPAVHAGPRQ
jgi:hypothetical protein